MSPIGHRPAVFDDEERYPLGDVLCDEAPYSTSLRRRSLSVFAGSAPAVRVGAVSRPRGCSHPQPRRARRCWMATGTCACAGHISHEPELEFVRRIAQMCPATAVVLMSAYIASETLPSL